MTKEGIKELSKKEMVEYIMYLEEQEKYWEERAEYWRQEAKGSK